jgi:hypothetical protein
VIALPRQHHHQTGTRLCVCGNATLSETSFRELYFRPRTPVVADDAHDDDRNDQMIESSSFGHYSTDDNRRYVAPDSSISIGISDRMYASHRCGLALGEFGPTDAIRGERDDDDPLQLCASFQAISATSAVTTDAGVMQLIAQRGYARMRTTNPIAVVAANQHPTNNCTYRIVDNIMIVICRSTW